MDLPYTTASVIAVKSMNIQRISSGHVLFAVKNIARSTIDFQSAQIIALNILVYHQNVYFCDLLV